MTSGFAHRSCYVLPATCHLPLFMHKLTAYLSALFMALAPLTAYAGLIRDAEIESTLRAYANPIFETAGIPADDVRILIVADPTINAFVAGGLNLFVHTGLIRTTKNPGELIGVIAHETGHIAGAHLSQLREKSNRATLGSIIGTLLGAAVMAGGGGKAGGGILMGSQQMAQRDFLGAIRVNESSADQAALGFLDDLDMSATGMLSMFETLRRKEAALPVNKDQYLRSHPLTTERISAMRNHITASEIPEGQVPEGFTVRHARMVAKLVAFTESYETTLNHYPTSDTSVAARYARAIADFKRSNLTAAIAGIDQLIREHPADPFFYDTKGQVLFENGKLADSAKAYAKASTLKPDSALILTDYAKTLIAQDKKSELPRAIALLERSREIDDSYSTTWRELAVAYGKQGRLGLSYEALAEESALKGDYKTVLQHVARARSFAKNEPALGLLLDDLERDAKAQIKRKREADDVF